MTKVRGRVSVHPRGFGFLELEGQPGLVAFIAPPELNPFLAGDVVSAALVPAEGGRYGATDLELVERRRTELFGTLLYRGKKPFLHTDRQVTNTDWALDESSGVERFREGAPLVARLGPAGLGEARALEAGEDPGLVRILVRHGVRTRYDEALVREAERVTFASDEGGRRDLRHLTTVTIDAASTRDIDDALAVLPAGVDGALRVFVSIADVDAFVPAGSPLDVEARARATSVYLSGHVVPMFPPRLSDDAISLVEGRERPAMTVELRIDDEGVLTSVDIYPSLIVSKARLTYDQVAAYFATGEPGSMGDEVRAALRWLRTAAARLSTVRAARGGVELLREETSVTYDANTNEPTGFALRTDTEAHKLIERLMVAANEAVARWLVDRGLPGIFRVHDEPDPDRVRLLASFAQNFGFEAGLGRRLSARGLAAFEAQFRKSPQAPAIRTALANVLPPARYTPDFGPHFGLAAPLYLHFTSPIRRYADLTVHRIVKAYLKGKRDFDRHAPSWHALAEHLQRTSVAADKAERDRLHALAARLFAGRLGETFVGRVVAVKPFGLIVQLDGTGVTAILATETLPRGPYRLEPAAQALVGPDVRYTIGQRLEVVVTAANEEMARIDVGLAPARG
jgi:ribonuclease R